MLQDAAINDLHGEQTLATPHSSKTCSELQLEEETRVLINTDDGKLYLIHQL